MREVGLSLFDRFATRFRPAGLLATLDDPRRAAALTLAFALVAPVLGAPFVVVFAVAGEGTLLALALAVIMVDLVAVPILFVTGSVRAYTLIGAWRLVVAGLLGHVLLGGFLWSGGYLWFGLLATIIGALVLRARDTVALAGVTLGAALLLAPWEGWLRGTRDAPALGVSVFVMVAMGSVTLSFAGTLIVLLRIRLQEESARSRELMLNILPRSIADRLKAEPAMIADRHDQCTVLFADLVGFTAHSKDKDPRRVVRELNTIFSHFDTLAEQHRAEKIKTLGDGYLAATGLPDSDPDHVSHACDLALAMLEAMPLLNGQLGTGFQLRVGVNTGPAVAGVVGKSKFSYDVWGDTVNLASRLEASGRAGVLTASAAVVAALPGRYDYEPAGIEVLKGHGPTAVYHVGGPVEAST